MGAVPITIGARENNDTYIQRIMTFSRLLTSITVENTWLGLNDFISEIFNDGIGEEFLAHGFNGGFGRFFLHVLKINFDKLSHSNILHRIESKSVERLLNGLALGIVNPIF